MDKTTGGVGFSAGLAVIIMWQLGYWQPEMMASSPVGLEAALTGVLATGAAYLFRRRDPRPPPIEPDEPSE